MNTERNKTRKRKRMSMGMQMILFSVLGFFLFGVFVACLEVSLYSSYAERNASEQNTLLTGQVLNNYEAYFKTISNTSNIIQDTLYNSNDIVADRETEQEFFDTIIAVKDEVRHIGVYSKEGTFLFGDSKNEKKNANVDDNWFQTSLSKESIDNFTPVSQSGSSYQISLSRYCEANKGETSCVFRLDLDFTSIVNSMYQVDFGTGGHIIIYDKDYQLVYTSASSYPISEVELLKKNVMGTNKYTIDGHDFVITQYTISNTTWRVALFSNIDYVREANRWFVFYTFTICIVCYVLFCLLVILLVRKSTYPLKQLQKNMNEVRDSDYLNYVPTKISGPEEVVELNESYQAMMTQIQVLMNNVVKEQTNQRKAEFKALTNQINPHFLYNTLDSIIYLIDENKNEEASTMVLALSRFFRISISKGKTIIPLKSELEHIRNYLVIQKMRYKDAFRYTIEAPEDCQDFEVIKLILQPIVENAIYHGIRDREDGSIDVRCHQSENMLFLSVTDNGYGMNDAKIKELRDSFKDPEVYQGVGLKNVYQRLKIYYGNKADVLISSELDVGTTITLVIPIVPKKEEEEKEDETH